MLQPARPPPLRPQSVLRLSPDELSFDDVAGVDVAKSEVREVVSMLRDPAQTWSSPRWRRLVAISRFRPRAHLYAYSYPPNYPPHSYNIYLAHIRVGVADEVR